MIFDVYTLLPLADRTVSVLLGAGRFVAFLMEDALREIPGRPVEDWKVPGETAIPGGEYVFYLEDSPRFGPDTATIAPVPGYEGIRMHANARSDYISHRSSEGCPLPGLRIVTLDGGDVRLTEDEAAAYRVVDMLRTLELRGEKSVIRFHRGAYL